MNRESPWKRPLDSAISANAHSPASRFAQLATISPDGRPANRTLVFRGFLDPSDSLIFVTDVRSRKYSDLKANPWAELSWYFSETREQFRLLGRVEFVSTGEAVARVWQSLSESSRRSFTWPEPGQSRAHPSSYDHLPTENPPSNFVLLLLSPDHVDLLDLRPFPHERKVFRKRDQRWTEESVNP